MTDNKQLEISAHFANDTIAYIPGLTIIFKSLPTGVLLSQLLYWTGKGKRKDGFIWKTATDLWFETGLTETQQRRAIDKLRRLQILDYKVAGIPATRHFRLNVQILHFVITRWTETSELVLPEEVDQFIAKQQTIPKTTQRNTTKKNPIDHTTRLDGAGSASASGTSSIGDILSSINFDERYRRKDPSDDIPF